MRVDVTRETKTPHLYGVSSGGRTVVAVYVQPSWIKVAEEGSAVVDGRFLVRLNAPTTRRARSGQAVRWVEMDGGLVARVERVSVLRDGSGAWTLRGEAS